MTAWIDDVLIVLGLIVMTLGVYGSVRFPDAYTQLHASSKAGFPGVSILLVATALGGGPSMLARVVLIVALLAITTRRRPRHRPGGRPPARADARPRRGRQAQHHAAPTAAPLQRHTWRTGPDPDPDQPSVTLFVDCPERNSSPTLAVSPVVLRRARRQAGDGSNHDPEEDIAKQGPDGDAHSSAQGHPRVNCPGLDDAGTH